MTAHEVNEPTVWSILPPCSQCGKAFTERACGIAHGIIASDPLRHGIFAGVLAERDVRIGQQTLLDAAEAVRDARENGLPTGVTGHPTHPYIEKWLRERADRIGDL